MPARAREMAKYIVETPEQAALHGEQWSAVNKLVKHTLEQSQREVLDVKATAGVGLVLDSTMDGALHIIEVVPGGAGAVPPLRVATQVGPTRVPLAAFRCRVSAARPRTDCSLCGFVGGFSCAGRAHPTGTAARPPAARKRTQRPLSGRNALVHACPFLAPLRVRSFPAGAHCGSPHARACAGRHPARFERAAVDGALRGKAQALYTRPYGYSNRTFYSARYVRKRGWYMLDPMTRPHSADTSAGGAQFPVLLVRGGRAGGVSSKGGVGRPAACLGALLRFRWLAPAFVLLAQAAPPGFH